MADRTVILHYHIFKNAGTSFNHALHEVLGDGFMEFDGDTASSTIPPGRIAEIIGNNPGKTAFSTHQGMLPPPEIPGCRLLTSLLLRHPLSRISSIYQFERLQDAQSPGALQAKKLSFGDYLRWRWDQSPAFFCFQSFFCARTEEHAAYRPLDTLFGRAMKNLESVDCVGTVERFDDFLSCCRPLLAAIRPGTMLTPRHANASANPPSGHEVVSQQILNETDADFLAMISPFIGIDEQLWSAFQVSGNPPPPKESLAARPRQLP